MVTPLHDNIYQLGDFTWNAVDDDGVIWFVTRDEDWWRGTNRRVSHYEKPFADGFGRSRSRAGARAITFEGCMKAPTRALRDARVDAFAALCGDGGTVQLIGPGLDGQYQLDVEYTDPPDIVSVSPREVKWQMVLIASSPLKRSVNEYTTGQVELPSTSGGLTFPVTFPVTFSGVVTSGTAMLTNGGTADVGLVLRIEGPAPNPRITLTRGTDIQTLRVDVTVEAGQWLTIDTAARTVMLNDLVSRRGMVAGTFPILAPGTSELSWNCDSFEAAARLSATWRYARY